MCRSSASYSHFLLIYRGMLLCRIPQTYHLYASNTVLHRRLFDVWRSIFDPASMYGEEVLSKTPPREDTTASSEYLGSGVKRRQETVALLTRGPSEAMALVVYALGLAVAAACRTQDSSRLYMALGPCGPVLEFCRGKTWLGRLTCKSDRYHGSIPLETLVPQRQKGA